MMESMKSLLLADLDDKTKSLILFGALILVVLILLLLPGYLTRKRAKKASPLADSQDIKKMEREERRREKKAKKLEKKQAKREAKNKKPEIVQEEIEDYEKPVSPIILDRAKYENQLKERLDREFQQKEAARRAEILQANAYNTENKKEFESHAGFISTLERFKKSPEQEERDKRAELVNKLLQEDPTSLSRDLENLSPELRAVVLSDIMNKKF